MNTMKVLIINTLFLLSAFSLNAQDVVDLAAFDGVSVLGNIKVTLVKGEKAQAIVETHDISEDAVSIFVKHGVLKLQLLKTMFRNNEEVNIKVIYTSELDFIKASAGAEISAKETIKSHDIEIKASSGAEIDIVIDVEKLKVQVGEGAKIELSGTAQRQYASATTGGEYDGMDLQCQETHAKANTGGQAAVLALQSLEAKANTGGYIEYGGQPKTKNINSALSGKIRKTKKVLTQ